MNNQQKTGLHWFGKPIIPLETIDGKVLFEKELPPIKFIINKILPQGLFILAGSPKVGKSWLMLDFCQAVATGGRTWELSAEKGEVLYLALEDSLSRLQSRLKKYTDSGIEDLHFGIRALKLNEGLVAQANDFIEKHPNTKLIVIDTMQHIRNNGNDKNAYVSDYRDMDILRGIINQRDIALILVTHTRKLDDPDPLNMISGSTGLVGAVDGVFILDKESRTSTDGKLTIANRDTEGHVFKLAFDENTCHWNFIEEEKEQALPDLITLLLTDNSEWTGTANELCESLTELDENFNYTVFSITKKLKSEEQILKKSYNISCEFSRTKESRLIKLFKI